jgi:hypothetical protein
MSVFSDPPSLGDKPDHPLVETALESQLAALYRL